MNPTEGQFSKWNTKSGSSPSAAAEGFQNTWMHGHPDWHVAAWSKSNNPKATSSDTFLGNFTRATPGTKGGESGVHLHGGPTAKFVPNNALSELVQRPTKK